jgi:putative salt-induced outer membrane protein YdiY
MHTPKFLLISFLFAIAAQAQNTEGFETNVDAGFTLTDGNSETTLLTLGAESRNNTDEREFSILANYAYGQTTSTLEDGSKEDTTNLDKAKLAFQANWLLSERAYIFANLTAEKDEIAKIDHRIIAGPGFGYYFLRDETHTLSTETSVVYVIEDTGNDDEDFAAFRFKQEYRRNFENGSRIWQSVELVSEFADTENYFMNAEIGVESTLTSRMALRLVAKNQYNNEPDAGIERNDFTLISGISVSL